MPSPSREVRSFRHTPIVRVLGSFASWFLFALCMTLLVQGFFGLMAIGGSCASGGPYVIETECPDAVAIFMPLSIFGGLAAVAIALIFAQGFGTSLLDVAWPILFGSLGAGFLTAFFATGDAVGLIIGGMFEIMAVIPLILALRVSVQRVFLGAINYKGERFYEGEVERFSIIGVRYLRGGEPVRPTIVDWSFSLVILIAAVALGYYAAIAAYASVGVG